jgi:hypothetical protein
MPAPAAEPETGFEPDEPGSPQPRARFAELEEPAYTPLPQDYATDLGNGVSPEQPHTQPRTPANSLFTDQGASQVDVDTPAYLRRGQF